MKMTLTEAQCAQLTAFLASFEDCEALSESEYVLDLYDIARPVSLNFELKKNVLVVDGAAELLFDEAMNGWYMGARIEQPEAVLAALTEAGALQ